MIKISGNLIHKILLQLNVCLKKLNEMHAIHKFINPENIFITYLDESKSNFDIKLGGYDLTNEKEGSRHSSIINSDEEINFIAPEIEYGGLNNSVDSIEEGRSFKGKCDLFSIGMLIYYLFTKEIPKKNESILSVSDPSLNDLIKKLLVENPDKRIDFEKYYNHPFFKKYHNLV